MSRLDEIRARVAAATPGPWSQSGGTIRCQAWGVASEVSDDDGAFIAHAGEDIPWLLAEIERLHATLNPIT